MTDLPPAATGRLHADQWLADQAAAAAASRTAGLHDADDAGREYLRAFADRMEQHARKLRDAAGKHGGAA